MLLSSSTDVAIPPHTPDRSNKTTSNSSGLSDNAYAALIPAAPAPIIAIRFLAAGVDSFGMTVGAVEEETRNFESKSIENNKSHLAQFFILATRFKHSKQQR